MISYKFHHKSSVCQLLDTDTLESAGVRDGDVLRLQPEITAGTHVSPVAVATGGASTWERFMGR